MKWEEINPMVRRAGHIIVKTDTPPALRKIYDFVLYYCRKGEARVLISREETVLKPGMFILIPPDTSHAISYEGEESFGLLWCHFDFTPRADQDELDRYVRSSYYSYFSSVLPRREFIRPIPDFSGAPSFPLVKSSVEPERDFERMSSLVTSYIRGEEEGKLVCKIHLLPILYFLLKPERGEKAHNPVVEEITRYVESHFDQPLTLKLLSGLFHYHEDYLGRLFREETGAGFRDYLNRLRVERSLEMLSGGSGLEEIAGLTGFCDGFYYSKVFKRVMGASPSRWREKRL